MRDYTTAELLKAYKLCYECEGSDRKCRECPVFMNCHVYGGKDDIYVLISDRLSSEQKKIESLKMDITARDNALERKGRNNDTLKEKNAEMKLYIASLETTVENQRKQIEGTYTADTYDSDLNRFCDQYIGHMCEDCPIESVCDSQDRRMVEYIREWAKNHPAKPKLTNGDKMRELFGKDFGVCDMCSCDCPNRDPEGYDDSCPVSIVGWEQMEYKQPSDK